MANEIIICAAQMAPNSEEKKYNADRILKMIGDAAKENVKIISFPECCLTPFFTLKNTKHFDQYFDTLPNEITSDIMKSAKENNINVILPYAEKTPIRYYNSAVVINSNGDIVGKYRKMHIPGAFVKDEVMNYEKIYFSPGDLGFPCFNLDGIKIGIQICYDRHFPEGFRSLSLSGAQIIFNVTGAGAYGKPWRSDTWELLLRARAFENGVYVVGVNKVGLEYGQDYFGRSLIASPISGDIAGKTQDHGDDELLIKRIDLDDITEARKRLPAFRDLRVDQYSEIYSNINKL